jgi:protein subunit release factor B
MSDASQVDPAVLPKNDYEALDSMSELTALLPDNSLRPIVLSELARNMELALGKKKTNIEAVAELPELVESDLVETFVKGSGPGGQKVNKTSNRVALLHVPTQIRIECQDTRSLQQNRKIARKRLRMKLDDHFNGKQSREQLKADKVISKKAKAQARSRKRQRQKQQEKETNKENLQT